MGIVDYFAKRAGYIKPLKRSFTAAKVNRLTSSWSVNPTSIDYDLKTELKILRARVREQAQNNDHVKQFLRLVKNNVVGHSGVTLQSKVKGSNGELDGMAVDAIESAWTTWGKHGNPDVTGKLSWKDVQRLAIEVAARDGESFTHIVRGFTHNKERFAVEFIDPDYVDVDLNRAAKGNDNQIIMGVEVDQWQRPVAYYVMTSSPVDSVAIGSKKYRRIPAKDMIHLFLPEWVNQTRGVPFMASALLRLNMLNGYEEAELVAARTAAAKMGFFQPTADAEQYTGEQDENGNFITDAEAGAFEILPHGYSFQGFDPQHPTTAFSGFVKAVLRGIASGLGVSYHSLTGDLEGANYSSLREGKLLDRDVWLTLQNWFIEAFCDRIYNYWLENQYNARRIRIGNTPLGKPIEAYQAVSWQGRRWQWVDPYKEVQAHKEAIALGVMSVSEVIRERGRDPEDVWQEIARDKEKMESLGIQTEPPEGGFLLHEETDGDSGDVKTLVRGWNRKNKG